MKPIVIALMGLLAFLIGCLSKGPYQKKSGAWHFKNERIRVDRPADFTPLNGTFARAGAQAFLQAFLQEDAGEYGLRSGPDSPAD